MDQKQGIVAVICISILALLIRQSGTDSLNLFWWRQCMTSRNLYSLYLWKDVDPDSQPPKFWREAFESIVGRALLHAPIHPKFLISETVEIETRDKHLIDARLHLPKFSNHSAGVLIRIHGGGWVIGSANDRFNYELFDSAQTNFAILDLNYRLAPEHRFPTQINDCYDTLTWVFKNGKKYGIDVSKIAVSGESAGGHLSSVLSFLSMREKNGPKISLQLLTVPAVEWDPTDEYFRNFSTHSALSLRRTQYYYRTWHGHSNETIWASDELASPIKMKGDWSELPKTVILAAEWDILTGGAKRFHEKLIKAGVKSEFHLVKNHFHSSFLADLTPYKREYVKAAHELFGTNQ